MVVVTNPYLRPISPRPWVANIPRLPLYRPRATTINNSAFRNYLRTGRMGIQSQHRQGSIKASKRAATGKKKVQRKVNNVKKRAFDRWLDCPICSARERIRKGEKGVRIPHDPHDELCPKNRKTKGWKTKNQLDIEAEEARILAINTAPIEVLPPPIIRPEDNPKRLHSIFVPDHLKTTQQKQPPKDNQPSDCNKKNISATVSVLAVDPSNRIQNPTAIREAVDDRLRQLHGENCDRLSFIHKASYPTYIGLAVDYVLSTFRHNKSISTGPGLPTTSIFIQAYENYRAFFPPGSVGFTFPTDFNPTNPNPKTSSPLYSFLEGQSIIHLDWKLIAPSCKLNCPHCARERAMVPLDHDRTNWSKNKTLFPIWGNKGMPTWCIFMNYKCTRCEATIPANDQQLLQNLPPLVRSLYPVHPRYAGSRSYHLHQDLTFDLELLLKTYANAKFFSEKLFKRIGQQYTDKLETYLCPTRQSTKPFPPMVEFTNGFYPPSASSLRATFLEAERSPCNPYGYSYKERYSRELQSVMVEDGENIAIDWTFQTIKNYKNLPNAKAVFTGNKASTREIFTLAIVPSTAHKDIAHCMMEAKKKREKFNPAILYTDTCPSGLPFWRTILGAGLVMRLGLFHLLHRIVDTLNKRCETYWDAMVKLQRCVYTYQSGPYEALVKALSDGTFDRSSKKYSPQEIHQLRRSPAWKQRFSSFLPKTILPGHTIQINLQSWIEEFKNKKDRVGEYLFSTATEKTTRDQLTKVEWVSDPADTPMYTEVPHGPKSTHRLSKWISLRPESSLEHFHQFLAHLANSGTNSDLADVLTLGGMCEHNNKCRWKQMVSEQKIKGQQHFVPSHFENVPLYNDHALLGWLNEQAKTRIKSPAPFESVFFIRPNNGEKFLAEYFWEQQTRIESNQTDPTTGACTCNACVAPPQPKETPICLPVVNPDPSPPPANRTTMTTTVVRAEKPKPTQQKTQHQPLLPSPVPHAPFGTYGNGWMGQWPMVATTMATRPTQFCCEKYAKWVGRQKSEGKKARGRPPHDKSCTGPAW